MLKLDNVTDFLANYQDDEESVLVETTSSKLNVNILNDSQKRERLDYLYADLPEALRPARHAQEQWWIAPRKSETGRVQGHRNVTTCAFPDRLTTIPLGFVGNKALALRCNHKRMEVYNGYSEYQFTQTDDEAERKKEEVRFFLHEEAMMKKLAQLNPLVAYRQLSADIEKRAYVNGQVCRYTMCAKTQEHSQTFTKQWKREAASDPTLAVAVAFLLKQASEIEPHLSDEKDVAIPPMITVMRDTTLEIKRVDNVPLAFDETDEYVGIEFNIDSLTLPEKLPVRPHKRERDRPKWKPTPISVKAAIGTVPLVAFGNEEHVAVLTQTNMYRIGVYTLGGKQISELHFDLPAQHVVVGLGCSHLEKTSVAFGMGGFVIYYDWNTPVLHVFQLDNARWVSSVRVVTEKNMVVVGTSLGEIVGLVSESPKDEISKGPLFEFSRSIAETEPVLDAFVHNNHLIVHTASGVVVQSMEEHGKDYYKPILRPLAVGCCGSLVFTMNKTGSVTICTLLADMAYTLPPLRYDKHLYTPFGTLSFKGIRVGPTRLDMLLPNGIVRSVEQALYDVRPDGKDHDEAKDSAVI